MKIKRTIPELEEIFDSAVNHLLRKIEEYNRNFNETGTVSGDNDRVISFSMISGYIECIELMGFGVRYHYNTQIGQFDRLSVGGQEFKISVVTESRRDKYK